AGTCLGGDWRQVAATQSGEAVAASEGAGGVDKIVTPLVRLESSPKHGVGGRGTAVPVLLKLNRKGKHNPASISGWRGASRCRAVSSGPEASREPSIYLTN